MGKNLESPFKDLRNINTFSMYDQNIYRFISPPIIKIISLFCILPKNHPVVWNHTSETYNPKKQGIYLLTTLHKHTSVSESKFGSWDISYFNKLSILCLFELGWMNQANMFDYAYKNCNYTAWQNLFYFQITSIFIFQHFMLTTRCS